MKGTDTCLSILFHIDTVTYHHDSEHCDDSIILIFIEFLCLQKTSYRRPRQCGRRQMGPTSCMLPSMTPRFEYWHFHGSDLAPLAVPSKGLLVCGRRSQSPELFATLRWVWVLSPTQFATLRWVWVLSPTQCAILWWDSVLRVPHSALLYSEVRHTVQLSALY
jgi:hypothetical protein